jgi:hypothetical protein
MNGPRRLSKFGLQRASDSKPGEAETMREAAKEYALCVCLFLFLLVVIGGGLHLSLAGAFVAAISGTPLVIHVFRRWSRSRFPDQPPSERSTNKLKPVNAAESEAELATSLRKGRSWGTDSGFDRR